MKRGFNFEIGEWYHCYSRGVDKRTVFEDLMDSRRFHELLYLGNDESPLHRAAIQLGASEIFNFPREAPLVSIGAYALMTNHYHLVLKEIRPNGITEFMRKIGTAYTMYFNTKYERVGNLFVKPFRAKHLNDDRYFRKAVHYVHLNPLDLLESGSGAPTLEKMTSDIIEYPFSSFADFYSVRKARSILAEEIFSLGLEVDPKELVQDAIEYRTEFEK